MQQQQQWPGRDISGQSLTENWQESRQQIKKMPVAALSAASVVPLRGGYVPGRGSFCVPHLFFISFWLFFLRGALRDAIYQGGLGVAVS